MKELSALEEDLDKRISKVVDEANLIKRKISAELKRQVRRSEVLRKQEQLSFTLHGDLVDGKCCD